MLATTAVVLISFANSLDPDQGRQNIGPGLEANCLTLWWCFWNSCAVLIGWSEWTNSSWEKLKIPFWQVKFFNSFHASGNCCHADILCKQFGPRSERQNVGSGLDPNCLTLWWCLWNSCAVLIGWLGWMNSSWQKLYKNHFLTGNFFKPCPV